MSDKAEKATEEFATDTRAAGADSEAAIDEQIANIRAASYLALERLDSALNVVESGLAERLPSEETARLMGALRDRAARLERTLHVSGALASGGPEAERLWNTTQVFAVVPDRDSEPSTSVATAALVEKEVNIDTLTLAERRERAENFQARVATTLGISPQEIDAEAARIAAVLPHIDLVEATRLARSSILAGRGVNVAAPGRPQYQGWDSKFAGMLGLWGMRASNGAEYARTAAALKKAGINVGDNDWLDPGADRWY